MTTYDPEAAFEFARLAELEINTGTMAADMPSLTAVVQDVLPIKHLVMCTGSGIGEFKARGTTGDDPEVTVVGAGESLAGGIFRGFKERHEIIIDRTHGIEAARIAIGAVLQSTSTKTYARWVPVRDCTAVDMDALEQAYPLLEDIRIALDATDVPDISEVARIVQSHQLDPVLADAVRMMLQTRLKPFDLWEKLCTQEEVVGFEADEIQYLNYPGPVAFSLSPDDSFVVSTFKGTQCVLCVSRQCPDTETWLLLVRPDISADYQPLVLDRHI
jgi:hypothetical protein